VSELDTSQEGIDLAWGFSLVGVGEVAADSRERTHQKFRNRSPSGKGKVK